MVKNVVEYRVVNVLNVHTHAFDTNVINAFDGAGTVDVVLQTSVRPNPIR